MHRETILQDRKIKESLLSMTDTTPATASIWAKKEQVIKESEVLASIS